MPASEQRHWIQQVADHVEEHVRRQRQEGPIVCASGISPSGPIHVGNLREVMTAHLVVEELKTRGYTVDHIHSWDDFDRLRKAPVGVPSYLSQYIGRALSDIPDPYGTADSYASHFIEEFEAAASVLGIRPRYVRQSRAYREGHYTPLILQAMEARLAIFDILAEHQTREQDEPLESRRADYYPFRVYCERCGKDATAISFYSSETSELGYHCHNCGNRSSFRLRERVEGKPPWKVDWPLRWTHEHVDFEPGGLDHAAPGSSYTVAKRMVADVFGWRAPYFASYAFVGMAGRSKMSSSAGGVATPRAALDILEPPILRWLYIRRQPSQQFDINFGQEVWRLYDEWDAFAKRVKSGSASSLDSYIYSMCVATSAGPVAQTPLPVSFRLLASTADITQGNVQQIIRIVAEDLPEAAGAGEVAPLLEPRLSCALNWASRYQPEDEKTVIRETFDADFYATLSPAHRRGIALLLDELEQHWSLHGLTKIIYGIPKVIVGQTMDAPPNDEIRASQRAFFAVLYQLICGRDTGPRLPTLFLSIGLERVRQLLMPHSGQDAKGEISLTETRLD